MRRLSFWDNILYVFNILIIILFYERRAVFEEQEVAVQKELSMLRASLSDVKIVQLEDRRELQDTRRTLELLDAERAELQSRLGQMEEKDCENRKEILTLKEKVCWITEVLGVFEFCTLTAHCSCWGKL